VFGSTGGDRRAPEPCVLANAGTRLAVMAKNKKSKKADADPFETLRGAFERTLQATTEGASGTQKRTRELVDEVARQATRIREALEDRRVVDELKRISAELEELAKRVTALESDGKKTAPRRRTTATSRASGAARPAAAKSKSTASRAKSARSRSTSSRSRAKSSGS
jgi:hypothetical protein